MVGERKTAIITGGGGGIGSAICTRLAADGFDVVIGYWANESGAAGTADECRQSGGRAIAVQADLAEPAEVRRLVDAGFDEFGRLDAFVHNAANAVFGSLPKLASERYDQYLRSFQLNSHALLIAAAESSRRMADGGRIVNISSVGAVQGLFGSAAYAASKAAAEAITRTAATELGGRGITCNSIQLGLVDTPTMREVTNGEAADFYAMQAPVRRVGEPADVAAMVSHLLGGESGWLTGQTIGLNGGFRYS